MTVDELGKVLNLKASYLKSHWTTIVRNYEKQNIELVKMGRGDNAQYAVKFPWNNTLIWHIENIKEQR